MRARCTNAQMMMPMESVNTKYISHGALMLKNTSREASVVRAVSSAEMAAITATGTTTPPMLARKRDSFGRPGWPVVCSGVAVIVQFPGD